MTIKLVSTKNIPEMKQFAHHISFECDNYHVYLKATFFQVNLLITQQNIEEILQKTFPTRIIWGDFIPRSAKEFSEILCHALSHTVTTYLHDASSLLNLVDINSDPQFIAKREEKFWNIISKHFPLPPKHIFEYEADEEKGARIVEGSWWEFFFVLCHDNHGLVLEGAAYD